MPELSILVVTYGNPDLTRDCLRSIIDETSEVDYELIVLDNASPDETPDVIAAEFPEVKLIALDENIGFARANNRAAQEATGEYLLLINPDTTVHRRALETLLAFARAHPEAGACGGRTLNAQGVMDPRSCLGQPTVWSTFCFASGLSTAFKGSDVFDTEAIGSWQRDTVRAVDVIVGCLLVIRRELWEELGGFDPRLFMYGEDTDLSIRLRERGYSLLICPDAEITHFIGASTANTGKKMAMVLKGRCTIMRTHWSRASAAVGTSLLLSGVLIRALGQLLRLPGRGGRHRTWLDAWRLRNTWWRGYS